MDIGCVVLEREKFPRYHIGESLIPFTFHPLERLGLIPAMKSSAFVHKYSIQFAAPSGKVSQPFYFFNRYDRETVAQTWQVLRSEFDQMLLDNARAKGAEVREETTVKELIWDDTRVVGVLAQDKAGTLTEYRAPITLDCTGKEAFTAVHQGWRMRDPYLNKVAVWTYYRGAKRDPGIDEGATTVAYVPEKGWFWYIPQHNDMVSVGVVAEGKYLSRDGVKSPEQMFKREVEQNAWIKDHLSAGEQVGRYFVTSEFSFHARHCGCEGLLLVGDAFAFLDPIFSSGVMLALKSGVLAGEAVHKAIVERNFSPEQFEPYARVPPSRRREHAQARLCLLRSGVFFQTRHRQIPGGGRRNHRLPLRRRGQGLQQPMEKTLRVRAVARGFAGRNAAFGAGESRVIISGERIARTALPRNATHGGASPSGRHRIEGC